MRTSAISYPSECVSLCHIDYAVERPTPEYVVTMASGWYDIEEQGAWKKYIKGDDILPKYYTYEGEDGTYYIEIVVPGWDKKNFGVRLEKDVVIVSGVADECCKEPCNGHKVSDFSLRFSVYGVDTSKLKANYKNGILYIEACKKENEKPVSVEIK